jgi:hypothetical protein
MPLASRACCRCQSGCGCASQDNSKLTPSHSSIYLVSHSSRCRWSSLAAVMCTGLEAHVMMVAMATSGLYEGVPAMVYKLLHDVRSSTLGLGPLPPCHHHVTSACVHSADTGASSSTRLHASAYPEKRKRACWASLYVIQPVTRGPPKAPLCRHRCYADPSRCNCTCSPLAMGVQLVSEHAIILVQAKLVEDAYHVINHELPESSPELVS